MALVNAQKQAVAAFFAARQPAVQGAAAAEDTMAKSMPARRRLIYN